jgi:hypothetical protein|tara:strand:+ start:893 stop:1084 length:192 start_codon:yes stop_codon:yes gene_type:complete
MAYSDKYPTCYDLAPIKPEDLTDKPKAITEAEIKALKLASKLRLDAPKASIRLTAKAARKLRR